MTFEKCDFVIDPEQENIKTMLPLQSELSLICLQIVELGFELLLSKDIPKEKCDQFIEKIESLSKTNLMGNYAEIAKRLES